MLQTLLEERFKLAVHREKREMQMFAPVVAGNGPRLHVATAGEKGDLDNRPGKTAAELNEVKNRNRGTGMRFISFIAIFLSPVFAQQEPIPKTLADSVAGPLKAAEGQLLSLAEAMPEAKYSFIPTAGKFDDARSFGEQIKHVACSQFAFFNEIEGKTPPAGCEKGGPSKAATKADLIQYLRDAFDYGNRVIDMVNANPLARVDGQYAGPSTRLGIAVTAVWHITDHYGQLVEYLRMNGIVPPPTQRYGAKVR